MLQRLLDGLAQSGLPGLEVDQDGGCALTFDGRITVNMDYDAEIDLLTIYCRLGVVPVDRVERIYPLLLEANVLWAGTGGATLGVIPHDRMVVLAYQERAAGIDSQRFEGLLSGLVDAAEFWIKLIEEESRDAGDSAGEAPFLHLHRV